MTDISKLIDAAKSAKTYQELEQIFDLFLYSPIDVNFGVDKLDRVAIATARKEANQRAIKIIQRAAVDPNSITEEDRAELRKYTGNGGIGGSTNEYYTPQWVASGVWDTLAAYGFQNGNVLEPSGGVGVFAGTKPKGSLMTSVELDKTSSAINAILHPEDHVVNSTFERYVSENLFAQEKFDAIVGNPPYGPRDDSMIQDVGYRDIKLADQYFVTRCIDMVRPGGLICLVLPSRIVEGSKLKKWRRQIAMKAEFLGAQRLPTGTFGNNGSDSVVTDVVIWRKHPAALAGSIGRASVELLESTNVLWDTWINGKWYQRDGKKYIHGTEHTVGQGAWARKVVDRGGRTDDDIKRALSHKFDSRIDWETLEIKAPETRVYAEGEYKIINGQQMRMDNGEWVSAVQQDATGSLNTAVYGVTSTDEIAVMTANQASMLKADFSHLKNIHRDLPGECDPAFIENMQAAMALPEAQQERAFRGMLLGQLVRDVSNLAAQQDGSEGLSDALTMKRENVAGLVFAEYEKFGLPTKLKHTSKLKGGALANWHAFAQSIDKNGTLSDLLDGKLKRESTVDFDHADPAQVAAAFYKQQMTSVDVATFRKAMTDPKDDMSDEQLLSWLAQQDGLAINSDGTISPIHHATSGEISAKLDTLYMAIKNALDTNVANNLQRQVELINSRRKWTDITDIKFKLTDGWIDKSILIEFLQSRGYDYFDYSKVIVGEDGTEKVVPADGDDGFFTGYRMRDGQKRNNQDERFERQLENYLNKAPVRGGGGNEGLAAIRDQLRQLDADFGLWLSTSDHADTVAAEYNSRFNGYIAPEYDDTSLELENLSGNIDLMGYQNATIRRFSDEGCGIIGYGTGLGKTFTGLGLAAYNIQVGRSKRVVFVVPKSVLENWYHEADTFFGANNLGDKVFIGIEPVKDKDGNVMREPVLDEEGLPVIKNGKPLTRAKLEVDTSTKKVAPKLHQLTHSSAKMVFMTKDVFASIPLREETISDNVSDMVDNGLVAGSNKYAAIAETYREQAKNAKFRAKHADDGSTKKHDLPYFEDLLIDSVITDEGHNYRNSYKSGGMGNRLAFLPNTQTANMALDMQIKNNYVKRVNRDRGCYSLTATPTVNSPIDAFNMLSQIIPQSVWAKMGIIDSDDFIRMFGKTGETAVHKLSGKVETKEALLGFQNLDALRSLFHRYTEIKNIDDVSDTVHIPKLITQTNYVDMSEEQAEIYENLRQRADALSNPDSDEAQEIAEEYPDDTVFGLIRDMDKACTDLDLYNGVMTYVFAADEEDKVRTLAADLPKTYSAKKRASDDDGFMGESDGEKPSKAPKTLPSTIRVETDATSCKLVVTDILDPDVIKRLKKFGLAKFSHPVPPKYAKFLEIAKDVYLDGGKQLVFTEEKTQHIKLARIIADYVGCDIKEIGILNSDTVAGKKGSGVDDDQEEAGLEVLASAYNEGRYRFMVLNKKGEVGVNLHRGTTDIHHLTLPFTPASLTQRNGRGARVGSKASSVKVHYYAGKGSFDKFRISTIERKARWINDLFTGSDQSVDNGNAVDPNEHMIMLAPDPEEARRRIEQNERLRQERINAEYRRVAGVNVSNYLKAVSDSSVSESDLLKQIEALEEALAKKQEDIDRYADRDDRWGKEMLKDAQKEFFGVRKTLLATKGQLKRLGNAKSAIKRYKPLVEQAIKDGLINVSSDIFTRPELYVAQNGLVARIGGTYVVKAAINVWSDERVEVTANILSFDRAKNVFNGIIIVPDSRYKSKGDKVAFSLSDIARQAQVDEKETELVARCLAGIPVPEIATFMDRTTFIRMAKEGNLVFEGGSKTGLIERDGDFAKTNNMADDADYLVYPDLSDTELQTRFARWCANHLMSTGGMPDVYPWPERLLGPDYKDRINQFGHVATSSEITAWVQETLESIEQEFKEKYDTAIESNNSSSWYSFVTRRMWSARMPKTTNLDDVSRISKEVTLNYSKVLSERCQDYIVRKRDSQFASYVALVADSNGRTERINQISAYASKYVSFPTFFKKVMEIYNDDLLMMMADLAGAGLFTQAQTAIELDENATEWRVRSKLSDLFDNKQTAILDIAAAQSPEVKDTVATLAPATAAILDNADHIALGEAGDKLKELGLVANTNTMPVTIKYGRRKTTFEPYTLLGMMDVNGMKGVLYKRKEAIKSQFEAKYGKDASDEFSGSWWFVPSNSDMTQLLATLQQ